MTGWLRAHGPRLVPGLAITAVAGVAGAVSYTHIYELTLVLHGSRMVARLMPVTVDGLITVGSVVLLQAPKSQPRLGWLGLGPGVANSVFANVESAIRWGWLSALWAGVPSASFARSFSNAGCGARSRQAASQPPSCLCRPTCTRRYAWPTSRLKRPGRSSPSAISRRGSKSAADR